MYSISFVFVWTVQFQILITDPTDRWPTVMDADESLPDVAAHAEVEDQDPLESVISIDEAKGTCVIWD